LLQCAKNSYVESLKKEMISSKSGFMLDEDWERVNQCQKLQ
jgi:hypothetical protein